MRRFALMLFLAALPAFAGQAQPPTATPIAGNITFFYYDDLPRATAFYQSLLGISPEDSPDWVRFFPLAAGAKLGLVDGTRGSLRPAAAKPVLLTLVLPKAAAVDALYARALQAKIAIASERKTSQLDEKQAYYAFMVKDPEGYLIEILAWVPPGGH